MKLVLTNQELNIMVEEINTNSLEPSTILPVMFNFYIQKNIQTLREAWNKVEQSRNAIIQYYGIKDQETNCFIIPSTSREEINKKLMELGATTQEIELYAIPITAFNGLCLTTGQLCALMPMLISDPEMEKRLLTDDFNLYERSVEVIDVYE